MQPYFAHFLPSKKYFSYQIFSTLAYLATTTLKMKKKIYEKQGLCKTKHSSKDYVSELPNIF